MKKPLVFIGYDKSITCIENIKSKHNFGSKNSIINQIYTTHGNHTFHNYQNEISNFNGHNIY